MTSKSDIKQKGVSAAKYTVVFKGLSQFLLLLVNVLIVRALSESSYGVYNLFYSVIALLAVFASMGIPNTLQRFIPEYYAKGEFRIANRLYRMASALRLLSSIILVGLILAFWETTAVYLKIENYKFIFTFFILIIFMHLQRQLLEICLEGYFLQKFRHAISIVFVSLRVIGYSLAILLKGDLFFIVLIDLFAYILSFFGLEFFYHKKIPKDGGQAGHFEKHEKARLIRYASYSNFNDAGVGLLGVSFDNFIIAVYLDPVSVGAYAFCNRLSSICQRLTPANYLLDVIRPLFFAFTELNESGKIRAVYQLLLKINYIFSFPLYAFVAVFGKEIILAIFGGKFIT